MAQWKFERRQGTCAGCEGVFEDGQRHASTLVTDEEGALGRRDLCDRCWRGASPAEGDEPETEFFWWFTRHQVVQRQSIQLDLETLERLFVELEGREELKVRELRYVLCLLLMRKRRVKLERVIREGENETFLVKRPRVEERYTVHVFDFDVARVAEIRAELQAIFDGADGEEGLSLAHLTGDESEQVSSPESEALGPVSPEHEVEEGLEPAGEGTSEEGLPDGLDPALGPA